MKIIFEPHEVEWQRLVRRPQQNQEAVKQKVAEILEAVKNNGDEAVRKYASQLDGLTGNHLFVTEKEIEDAALLISDGLKNAIAVATQNIEKFHAAQREFPVVIETTPGVKCWRKTVAIEKVGLYVPGGTAPLFSTLLMLGIPAVIAGCEDITVCTPAGKTGLPDPVILYVAGQLGIKKICKIGGAQAIAAMAYGTETINKVNKIFGPGNAYVTMAKQLVNREGVAIDIPAGPSEVAIYADATSVPAFVAADLLSQAEHGPDSQVLLVAPTKEIVKNIIIEMEQQLERLPRKDIAAMALQNSSAVIMTDTNAAFKLLNLYASEHLIIASENAAQLSSKVSNAGSVFLGNYSPESVGDYASGTNHTLPTNGYATAYSGVSLDSFVKKITFQQLSAEGLENIGPAVEIMATAEGLAAHKESVTVRLNYKTASNEV